MTRTVRHKRLRLWLSGWTLVASLGACSAGSAPTPSARFALADVNVVDVRSGRILPHRSIVIEGDRIVAVQLATDPLDRETRVVAATGRFVMPGLWDMHVHVADDHYLDLFIANGITGVRDMGGNLDRASDGCESLGASILRGWRSEIAAGARTGPELVIAGRPVNGNDVASSLPARSPEEARSSVAALRRDGVDFIKVYERLSVPAFLAVAQAARDHGLVFAGHLSDEVGPIAAIRAGQRSIEHVRDPILVCFTPESSEFEAFMTEDRWGEADRLWGRSAHASCPALIEAFRTHSVWLTPTLTVERAKVRFDDPGHVGDRRRQALPPAVRQGFADYVANKQAQTATERLSEQLWWGMQSRLVGRLNREGVRMLAGTDSACQGGLPGASLHDELAELVSAGLSPVEALRSATMEPARYLGRNRQGEVRPQYRADLLILDEDPLADIGNSRRIRAVIARGRFLDRPTLDRLLGR